MLEEEPATILIAGGGIVGLSMAMAIKKQLGVIPEVYEKTRTFATEAGAGLGMYPNGLRVLRDISPDLLKMVRDAGYPYRVRHWERHTGEEVMKAEESVLSAGERELDSIGIRRSTLQQTLYKFATSQGITVKFRKPLLSAEQREDGLILVKFGDGTSRLTKVLFGADGALGKTRSIVAGPDDPALKYTGTTCLMGLAKIPCDGIYFPSSEKQNFHAVFFPTRKDEMCFQFHMPIKEEQSNQMNWGNLSDEVGQQECQKIAKELRNEGWAEKFIEPLDKSFKSVRVGFALLEPRLKTWVNGRIALVGDAAHPPVPYVGQGAQQGLEDAGVAVAMLKLYCLDEHGKFDPTNFEKAMTVYQKIRTVRSSQILDISKSLGEMQSSRTGRNENQAAIDEVLRGEVLMHGTLPVMSTGADHDYKDDIREALEEDNLAEISVDAALEAMDHILGLKNRVVNSTVVEKTITAAQKRKVNDSYALAPSRVSSLSEWIFTILERLLRKIVARRNAMTNLKAERMSFAPPNHGFVLHPQHPAVDELSEVIPIPIANEPKVLEEDFNKIKLSIEVQDQLRRYVYCMASLYRANPFHNFEHACNVAMNMYKLLSHMRQEGSNANSLSMEDPSGKDQAYGIKSDPLTQFACLYAALIHDGDHEGVPNTQVAKEHPEMEAKYKGHALAEQNSLDLAWNYFMEPEYDELRHTIYGSDDEMQRFRKIAVNLLIATDICDRELKEFREARVRKAESCLDISDKENIQRKATIGIEYLIQASDVSHTMQPWTVYRKWNRKLYHEMYKAYKEGRAGKDPREFWYKGEIAFFDYYIIPLAEKLQNFEIFGSVSEEFLERAKSNRNEWKMKGEAIVQEMVVETEKIWSIPLDTLSTRPESPTSSLMVSSLMTGDW